MINRISPHYSKIIIGDLSKHKNQILLEKLYNNKIITINEYDVLWDWIEEYRNNIVPLITDSLKEVIVNDQ